MIGRFAARYGRAGREYLYLLVSLPLTAVAFALAVVAVVAGALTIVLVGVPVLLAVLAAARQLPRVVRTPARALLGWDWPDPPPAPRSLRGRLTDGTAWRSLAYAAARLPLTVVGLYIPAGVLIGVVLVLREAGSSWTLLATAEVIAAIVVLPWFVRLIVAIDRTLAAALLGQHPDTARVRTLEAGRAAMNADALRTSRRLERDLHDGTQARLVAIGMQLSRLEAGTAEPATSRLAGEAKHAVTDALAELRDIICGIHPPALDDGLDTALATLAARSPVPTSLDNRLCVRPPEETTTALFFAASELLTNVARHAHATSATIEVIDCAGAVALTVADDGWGGATADPHRGGLTGLRQRLHALDGTVDIDSPAGGPTRITVTLPAMAQT